MFEFLNLRATIALSQKWSALKHVDLEQRIISRAYRRSILSDLWGPQLQQPHINRPFRQ